MIANTNQIAMPETNGIAGRPARRGEYLTVYASGLGDAMDAVPTGTAAPLDRPVLLSNKVKAVIGGVEIEPAFAGLAPGTAGIFQVDDLLATKIRGTPLEGRVEVVARIEGESEKRLLSGFTLS